MSALAFASKSSWGYDAAFMEACRAELTVHPHDLERGRVRVAVDGELLGFSGVIDGDLEWLFVAPDAMGRGVGAALLDDACAGQSVLRVEADPHAAGFYERMGARRIGEVESGSIPGRALPVYEIAVS